MRQDVGGVNITPTGEDMDQNRMADEGLVSKGDNMAAEESVGHDMGSVGGDDSTLGGGVGRNDGVRDDQGEDGENLHSVEMGDIRDSESADMVEKKEDPLGVEVDKGIVTDNVLNR